MRAFNVAPFIPVAEQEPRSDVGFYFALLGCFVPLLIAIVIAAIRIDLRRERYPFTVG